MSSPRRPTCRPGGNGNADFDLRTDQSRVLGRYDRVGAGWKRGPGHDSHGGARTHFAGVRLPASTCPTTVNSSGVYSGRTGRERAVQRVAVHRGAIECRNVARRDHLLREHAIGCGVDGRHARWRGDTRARRSTRAPCGPPHER
jgi:hypothetical protein